MPSTGYNKYRHDFAKLIWQTASPKLNFNDATFDRSAASLNNPDHISIVIHNYRWRLGLADGGPRHDNLEKRLAEAPVITVPTITLEGDANGAPRPSTRSTATDRRAHAPTTGTPAGITWAPCPVLIPSSGEGAPPLPPPRLRGRKRRASAGIRRPCRRRGLVPGAGGAGRRSRRRTGGRRGRVGPAEGALLGWRGRGHCGTPGPLASRSAYSRWWRR